MAFGLTRRRYLTIGMKAAFRPGDRTRGYEINTQPLMREPVCKVPHYSSHAPLEKRVALQKEGNIWPYLGILGH